MFLNQAAKFLNFVHISAAFFVNFTVSKHRFAGRINQEGMNKLIFLLLALLFSLMSCHKDDTQPNTEYSYNFSNGTDGWQQFFSDYPVGSEVAFELEFEHTNLPDPLDNNVKALMISGNNHSDDLLSFIYRKFDGLQPNKTYAVTFDVNFASNAPSNAIGIGGSPDLAFGVGGIPFAPANTPDGDNWHRPNFKSDLQSRLSNDTLQMTGTIGVGEDATDFALINHNNNGNPIMLTANNNGELWLMMGTDSGFEGTTTLYYTSIKIKLD